MNAIEFAASYSTQIVALAALMNDNADANKANAEAGKSRKATLTQSIKDFALTTAVDGVPLDVARKGLTYALTGLEVPAGSRKASGNHFAGFRAMLDANVDIDDKTVKDAQNYIASDDVKERDGLKKKFREHTAKWTTAQWHSLLVDLDVIKPVIGNTDSEADTDATAEEVDAVIARAA